MVTLNILITSSPDDCYYVREVPVQIPGVDLTRFNLNHYYPEEQVREILEDLKRERLEWLSLFPGLDMDIIKAVKP